MDSLVHCINCGVDFFKTRCLLFRAFDDSSCIGVDLLNLANDFFESPSGLSDKFDPALDVLVASADERLDLFRRFGRALGELADFLCYNGKTLACLSRTGRLDPSVNTWQYQ